jgi:membrane-associated phospholipid phosphatase
MHFLKENNKLAVTLFALGIFALSVLYLDKFLLSWTRELNDCKSSLCALLDTIYPFISYVSNGLSFIAVILVLFILAKFYNKRFYEVNTSLCAGFAATGIVAQLLKHLIGRARPKLTDNFIVIGPSWESKYDSIPSGHTAVAFCFASILSEYYPKHRTLFYLLAILVGVGRLKIPSHFLSDVVAGAVIGLFIGKATFKYCKLFINKRKPTNPALMGSHHS